MRNRELKAASGFTLLEIMVALTVMAIGAAVTVSLLTGSLGNVRKAQLRGKIIEHAESVMETVLLDDTILSPTTLTGDFEDGTNWNVNIEIYTPDVLPTSLQSVNVQNLQYQLMLYTIDMFGPGSSVVNYRLQTLKLTKVQTSTTSTTGGTGS
jgi:prepilin-type N-terminal cleavage/methylation domain-containing protein